MNALIAKFQEANDEDNELEAKVGSIQQISALADFFSSKKTENKGLLYVDIVIKGKPAIAMLDIGTTHNFIDENEALRLGLDIAREQGTIKAVNSEAKPATGIARNVPTKIGYWQGTLDFTVVSMDDFKIVLGISCFKKALAFSVLAYSSLVILNDHKIRVIPLRNGEKMKNLMLSTLQFKRRLGKDTSYLTSVRELQDNKEESHDKPPLPRCIKEVLANYKDVMSTKLPNKLPTRREVDHEIELEPCAKPPAMAPYRMAPPELEELQTTQTFT